MLLAAPSPPGRTVRARGLRLLLALAVHMSAGSTDDTACTVTVDPAGGGHCGASRLANLTDIRLSNLSLPAVPTWPPAAALPAGVAVISVDLSRNALTVIEASSFRGLANLTVLDLRHNAITHVARGSFASLARLLALKLGSNGLGSAVSADWLGGNSGLGGLQELDLESNSITHLQDGCLRNLPALATLRLSRNAIRAVGAGTFRRPAPASDGGNSSRAAPAVPMLAWLSVSDNQITEVHADAFAGLTLLVTLDLTGNRLTRIDPGWFRDLGSLWQLSVQRNMIAALQPGLFSHLGSLEKLILDDNRIRSLGPGVFGGGNSSRAPPAVPMLAKLYISDNQITEVHADAFAGLTLLGLLQLTGNRLTRIDPGWFQVSAPTALVAITSHRLAGPLLPSPPPPPFAPLCLSLAASIFSATTTPN